MQSEKNGPDWGFDAAIDLLHDLHLSKDRADTPPEQPASSAGLHPDHGLGDFSQLWEFLGRPFQLDNGITHTYAHYDNHVAELEADPLSRNVRWRDELDGADLEDNVEPDNNINGASAKTRKRAERRSRARERAAKIALVQPQISDTGTEPESADELETLRRSPDRRAVIAEILGHRKAVNKEATSPPTTPSPPTALTSTPRKKPLENWPLSNPFSWQTPRFTSSQKQQILPKDGLSPRGRKNQLISSLISTFKEERKFLKNAGLIEPAFTPLNISPTGIHVFIDISNIMIGFHDCLKMARDIPRETRTRRVPMQFHNLSLVLERGRPAAKRVLVGSDRCAVIEQAKSIGYETNILERVHKAKETASHLKRFRSGAAAAGSGLETSGSETNPGIQAGAAAVTEKWVEQAVDEILHLKILESLVDAEKPSTIVLATGDAAEAEYSGGFMRMVERALEKGWMVELVSFRLNTSNAYRRRDFRTKWGPMFKWIQLDDFVEQLIDEEE